LDSDLSSSKASETELIPGESVVRRPARALVGWLSEQESANFILGRNPAPTEDVSAEISLANRYAAVVAARKAYEPEDPRVLDGPFGDLLEEVAARAEVKANFHNMRWKPAVVDLRKLLSFQKIVFTDSEATYAESSSVPDLMEICLPSKQPGPPSGAIGDPDGKGFTISSLNSNLRIVGGQLGDAHLSPGPGLPASVRVQAVTLFVSLGTSYLQVVHYRDRYFLRDGYHRAARLILNGITIVPCIYIEVKNFEEMQVPSGGFSYEVLFGERPPTLTDFWDESVSIEISQLAIRKVIRVRGEEFAVPR
jgi:hypothetical protein